MPFHRLLAVVSIACALGATAARAEPAPAGTSAESFPAWWARPGRPAFVPDAFIGTGLPQSYAGLVLGGWAVRDAALASAAPSPGIPEAEPPLAWADSATVVLGEDAAWEGFGAGIARLETFLARPRGRKPRAMFTAMSGSSAIDRSSLFLTRSDRNHWLALGATGQRRGAVGALDLSGEHLWTAGGGLTRGAHTYRARFTQRGMGASLAYPLRESGSGQSSELGYDWRRRDWRATAGFERGMDARTSGDANFGSGFLDSRRDAQQSRVLAELAHEGAEGREAVRLWARRGQVIRTYSDGSRFAWNERALWSAARLERPWQSGTLALQLGGGWSDAAARGRERSQLAPGLSWRYADERTRLRLFTERVVDPVWSDLSAGVKPFVQDTWVGGLEAGVGRERRLWLDGAMLLGRTGNKATLVPYPLRDVQLRLGYDVELRRKDFTLVTLDAGVRGAAGSLEASGFAMTRDRDGQRWIDPGLGARIAAETGVRLFTGDLLVRLRAEGAYVGSRETDIQSSNPAFGDEVLAGFATAAASLSLTIGDATLRVRADNLEDRRRPQAWLDPLTGAPALGTGRQVRAALMWPFYN